MSAEEIIGRVSRAIHTLVASSEAHEGLFLSILDRTTERMLRELPPRIEGQRGGDRSHLGSNLIHDEVLLRLPQATGPRS